MSAVLLMLLVAGTCAKSLDQLPDDTINKIDEDPLREIRIAEREAGDSVQDSTTQSPQTTGTSKPSLLTWFLTPLTQNLQINPQSLQNRVAQLKETLSNLGLRKLDDIKGKQLNGASNFLNLIGADDTGLYTNGIEPAGFFGGNGWLANKGGILGGPGAILSTGSIHTDYPSAYRKK